MKELKDRQVDGFSFTENNRQWTPEQIKAARNLGKYWFKQFSLQTSLSNDPTTRKAYQPGGTCTGVINNLAGRITTQGSDPSGLGRWTYMCLEGKTIDTETSNNTEHRQIYTITGYCPPQQDSSTPGDDTAFMQQKRLLTMQGVANPLSRMQWFEDLTKHITEWQSTEADVLLCMDANADLQEPHLRKILTDTGMVDLVANKLGSELPETYVNGKRTDDHLHLIHNGR